MKKPSLLMIAVSVFLMASPVFAGHDHGASSGPVGGASHTPSDDQSAKEGDALIANCAKQISNLQWRMDRFEAGRAGKGAGRPVLEELKKLQEKLKEANDIAKLLQVY